MASPPIATPAPPPAPPWAVPQLRELVEAIGRADGEGLRSSDYTPDALQRAVEAGRTGPDVDTLADTAALALAHDFAAGRVRNHHRFNWYIDYAGPPLDTLGAQIVAARTGGHLGSWLAGLLPTDPAYGALRDALADTPADDATRRDRIKANMERWRWLPRGFGTGNQLYVNLPTYRLEVIRDGETLATYKAVIGATDMPTPALSAAVRQVIVNPDWILPQSIVRKSHLRPGVSSKYIFSSRPDGTLRVRQRPGAGNPLGKVKIEFPNALAIYFHDTPSRSLFGASARTFSHGCVRVQDIDALARSLVGNPERFDTALAGAKTRSLFPASAWRANIVYLTLVPDADGTLADVGDPYGMDGKLAAALEGRKVRPPVAPMAAQESAPAPAPSPQSPTVPAPPSPPSPPRVLPEPGSEAARPVLAPSEPPPPSAQVTDEPTVPAAPGNAQ